MWLILRKLSVFADFVVSRIIRNFALEKEHITRIVCDFLPAGRRIQGGHILYNFCDGVKAVWQKGYKR